MTCPPESETCVTRECGFHTPSNSKADLIRMSVYLSSYYLYQRKMLMGHVKLINDDAKDFICYRVTRLYNLNGWHNVYRHGIVIEINRVFYILTNSKMFCGKYQYTWWVAEPQETYIQPVLRIHSTWTHLYVGGDDCDSRWSARGSGVSCFSGVNNFFVMEVLFVMMVVLEDSPAHGATISHAIESQPLMLFQWTGTFAQAWGGKKYVYTCTYIVLVYTVRVTFVWLCVRIYICLTFSSFN